MGLTMQDALSVPFSLLLDLIAIQQIQDGTAKRILTEAEETAEFMKLLAWK